TTQITTATATGTIQNDDTGLAIAATNASLFEGTSGATPYTFTVTRSGNTTGTTTVNYAVTGSTLPLVFETLSPADPSDFVGGSLPSGTVTFNPGVTTQTITINVNGDSTIEPDEGFTVTLSGANPGTTQITTASAIGAIFNDDGSFTLSISPLNAV